MRRGYLPCLPPHVDTVGEIIKFFPKIGVYGVCLYPTKTVRRSITLLIRSENGYDARAVTSLEVERRPVEVADGGAAGAPPVEVAVKLEPTAPRLQDGAAVFVAMDS